MTSSKLKFSWMSVIIWFAIFYYIGEPLHNFIVTGTTKYFLDLSSFKNTMWTISMFVSFSLYSLLAYSAMYLFYPYKKWSLLFCGLVFSVLFPIGIRALLEQFIYDVLFGFTNYFGVSPFNYIRDNIYFAFKYMAVGIGYFLWSFSIYKEKTAVSLELENQKMKLSVLRSQVNPHFLLNSLNNIYSLVYQRSDKSLDALDKLTDLLKYNLYSTRDKVQLKEELDYLDKYIELQGLRYSYPIEVVKNISPTAIILEIPQLLLLPLVENAFKHGSLKDHPIILEIVDIDKKLVINVSNMIGNIEKDSTKGVGLENVKNRLRLFYQENSTFKILEENGLFKAKIEIPL